MVDYLLLARIGKLVALLGFFLPWVTVSCSGTEILQATGWQLMTGDLEPSGAFAGAAQEQTDDAEPAAGVIVAFAVVVIGVIAGWLTKGRTAAIVIAACALLGIGLSYFSLQNMRSEMVSELNDAQTDQQFEENDLFSADQQRDMARAAASAIQIEEQEGYWLTLGALGASMLLCLLIIASAARPTPLRKPDDAVS